MTWQEREEGGTQHIRNSFSFFYQKHMFFRDAKIVISCLLEKKNVLGEVDSKLLSISYWERVFLKPRSKLSQKCNNNFLYLVETRLTYDCAHLRSTKESLTIFWEENYILGENFLLKFFFGWHFFGVNIFRWKFFGWNIFLGQHFWGENFLGEKFFWVKLFGWIFFNKIFFGVILFLENFFVWKFFGWKSFGWNFFWVKISWVKFFG